MATEFLSGNRLQTVWVNQPTENTFPSTGLFNVFTGINLPYINTELSMIDDATINPLNQSMQRQKLVGASAKINFEQNLTYHSMYMMQYILHNAVFGATLKVNVVDTFAATTDNIAVTVAMPNALIASRSIVLIKGFGATNPDGVYLASAAAQTTTSLGITGIVAQAAIPSNAELHYVGVKGASGDITITAGGNIASTVLDFTTIPFIKVGVELKIGGGDAVGALGGAASRFATAGNNTRVRVLAVTANLITVTKSLETNLVLASDTGTSKTIEIYGMLNLKLANYTAPEFIRHRIAVETYDPIIDAAGKNPLRYAQNGVVSSLEVGLPLADRATMKAEVMLAKVEDNIAIGSKKAGFSTAITRVDSPTFVPKLTGFNCFIRIGNTLVPQSQDITIKIEQEVQPIEYQGLDTATVTGASATQLTENVFTRAYNDFNKVKITLDINNVTNSDINDLIKKALQDTDASIYLQYIFPQTLQNSSNLAAAGFSVEISRASFDIKNDVAAEDFQKATITLMAASSSNTSDVYVRLAYATYLPYVA